MTNLLKNASLPPHYKDGTGGSKTIAVAELTGRKVICKTFLPGDRMAPHHAPTDVFALVLNGQMDILLNDKTSRFVAGDYVVFPAGTTHALTCIETARLLIFR